MTRMIKPIMSLAAVCTLLSACGPSPSSTTPQPSTAATAQALRFDALPAAVRETASPHMDGTDPSSVSVMETEGDYLISFSVEGVHYRLDIGAGAKLKSISETVRYSPLAESARNVALSDAASLMEDYVEAALSGDDALAAEKFAAFEATLPGLQTMLGNSYRNLETNAAAMASAISADDLYKAEITAVENYLLLINQIDEAGMTVPLDVSRLDYVGFKLKVLGAQNMPDWGAIARTAEAATRYWNAISSDVSNKGLSDLMTSVQEGIVTTAAKQDRLALDFAAQMELDAVDLLEHYFDERYKTGAGAVK